MNLPKTKVLKDHEASGSRMSDEERAQLAIDLSGQGKASDTMIVNPIQCFGEWVAVVPIAPPEVTAGGIHVPDADQKSTDVGIIVGFGPDARKYLPVSLGLVDLIGEHVKYGSRNVPMVLNEGDLDTYDGYTVHLVNIKNIICLVNEKVEVEIRCPEVMEDPSDATLTKCGIDA